MFGPPMRTMLVKRACKTTYEPSSTLSSRGGLRLSTSKRPMQKPAEDERKGSFWQAFFTGSSKITRGKQTNHTPSNATSLMGCSTSRRSVASDFRRRSKARCTTRHSGKSMSSLPGRSSRTPKPSRASTRGLRIRFRKMVPQPHRSVNKQWRSKYALRALRYSSRTPPSSAIAISLTNDCLAVNLRPTPKKPLSRLFTATTAR